MEQPSGSARAPGGEPPAILANDFRAWWKEIEQDALAAVRRVGESGWLILGQEVKAFETALAARFGVAAAVGSGNGMDALELGLRALGVRPGQKVLTTPLSAFASTLAILRAGAVPVFVDVDERGLVDLDLAEREFEKDESLRFFLPVHLFGFCLDLERLESLRARFDLRIVEDCAQSIGATWKGRHSGTVGQAAGISFYPTKNLGAMGDGGGLLTGDESIAESVRALRNYGQSSKYVHDVLGMNSRLDELQAAILNDAILPRLDEFLDRRGRIAERYRSGIENERLQLLNVPEGSHPSWHLFPVIAEGSRDSFLTHLSGHGIGGGVHYPVLIPDQKAVGQAGLAPRRAELVRAARFAAQEVSLPMHPFLTETEVERVIAVCNEWH